MAGKGEMSASPFRHDSTATPNVRDMSSATPRTGVSFSSDIHWRDFDPDGAARGYSLKSISEMQSLRSIQTARAVVASERQHLLSRTQLDRDKEWSPSKSSEPAKRASEEQLFEEVGLLMQERDLLIREKSALQTILSSSAEEIRRLFDAEQKHVGEMRMWLEQKESLERENDDANKRIDTMERELDDRNKELDRIKVEKHSVEKTLASVQLEEEDLQERLAAAQQELGIRRVNEQTHKTERNEWLRQQDDYIKQLATSQAEVRHQASYIEQLKDDAALHRKAAEIWEEDRRALLEDRAEKERLRMLDEEHKEAQRRWAATQEQLLKERSESNAQVQLGLQQLEQQQKVIEVHNQEKAQWLKNEDAHLAARSSLETRCNTLEAELNSLKVANGSLLREKEDLIAKLDRLELDFTDSGRHLAAARSDFERVKQQKNHISNELDVTRKELAESKDECADLENTLREARSEVKRLAEYEVLFNKEREERLLVESRMNQRTSELHEALRQAQNEARQYHELTDALRTEVQQISHEKKGLLEERSRLQYRLKLTLQELEHLRANEKRYESESADWLHTHSALLERVIRHGRD
jgi:chromosome segregation ATPase